MKNTSAALRNDRQRASRICFNRPTRTSKVAAGMRGHAIVNVQLGAGQIFAHRR